MVKISLFLFFIFLLLSCAVQGPPSGGPVDRTPPEIVNTTLLPGSIHVPTDLAEIAITFSERMKEGSERNNVFVSPPVAFETEWKKGKILKITLQESLKPQQTYVFTIGTGLQDLRNNKMAQSFPLAFSTGDTIDQGRISGKVYGLQPDETFYVFAYYQSDSLKFDPFHQRPDYISQTGEQGQFVLGFLRNGCYRILAVQDRNHNLLLDAALEKFAIGYSDVCLDSLQNRYQQFALQPATFDTIAPKVISVRALFQDFVRVRFSEPLTLDSSFSCQLSDSLRGQPVPFLGWGKNPENANWLEFVSQPLDSGRTYGLHFSHLQDSSGNRHPALTVFFKSNAKVDTSQPRLVRFSPADSARNVRPETKIKFTFSQPVNWQKVQQAFALKQRSGRLVNGHWRFPSLYTGIFYPDRFLQPDSQYFVSLDLRQISDLRGQHFADSVHASTFFVVSARELGEVSGTLTSIKENHPPVVLRLKALGRKPLTLKKVIQKGNRFKFEFVPEGEFLLEGFVDLNANGKFDRGGLLPFHFCEPFRFWEDTIRVRKRWETAGLQFNLPEVQP